MQICYKNPIHAPTTRYKHVAFLDAVQSQQSNHKSVLHAKSWVCVGVFFFFFTWFKCHFLVRFCFFFFFLIRSKSFVLVFFKRFFLSRSHTLTSRVKFYCTKTEHHKELCTHAQMPIIYSMLSCLFFLNYV